MMITKTTPKGWMLTLLSALFMLSGLTACSSTEDSAEDSPKPKPEVPVNDGDWQTVPTSGGTITKDSISITFPSGTFSEDAKVAITEIQEGKIGGEYEASKFYQIVMPCTASKPIIIKMKSKEFEGNISFVAQADAFSICSGETRKVEHHYDTSYSNGEYSSTIPAINGDLDENIYFTIGLGRILDPSTGKARTREWDSYKNQVLFEGKVKNVNYQIRYMWTILDQIKWSINGDTKLDSIINISGKINNYVRESMTKIMDLGFKVDGNPTIYIDFDTSEKDWGGHQFCLLPLSTSWSTYVSLGTKQLLAKDTRDEDIKCTIIHEVFHWYQTHYDPRSNWKKAKGSGDYIIFYEMGGAWIENLINDSQLNAIWLNGILKEHVLAEADRFGLTDTKDGNNNKEQGYLMAPLLYYMCSSNAMKEFGFSNKSILELHELFSGGFKVEATLNPFADDSFVGTLSIMNDWAKIYHDSNFFTGDQIDDYYIKLLNGSLVKGTDIFSIWEANKSEKGSIIVKDISNANREYKCDFLYPYGCNFRAYHLITDKSLKDKKLVLKQKEEGVQTYVLTANKTDKKYERIGTVAQGQDSIVVSGDKLETYRKADGTFDQYFFMLTTRILNDISDKGAMPWVVTVELQGEEKQEIPAKVEPDEVTFEAEGGTNSEVKITKGSYKHCDVDDIATPYNTWLSAKCSADGIVTIEAQPNTSTEGREGKVYCWVSNKENPSETDKKYLGPVIVIQKASDGSTLLDRTDLEFPVEGGAKFIGYSFGTYLWMKRDWENDTWLRTAWSKDYLNNISYNPSSDNRFANQLYVCCFPNETGMEREQTVTFSYSMIKGFEFDTGDKFPVKIKQEGGSFNMDMMKNFFVGTWYTPQDITYSNGNYYHRRYTFRSDNTFTFEGQTTKSTSKPSSWEVEVNSTYSILSYEVKGECVKVYIKIPGNDGVWYKGLIERWPHFIFFAYENTDGSLRHGVYMEPE